MLRSVDIDAVGRHRRRVEPGQGGVELPSAADRLPRLKLGRGDAGVAAWWVGVHGGRGESTLEQVFAGTRAAGHRWPVPPPGNPPAMVVLVARTNARGLRAAQSAMREWQAGELGLAVVGLVLMADAPGRLPRPLRDLARVVAGGVSRVWSFPWVSAWRVGELPTPANSPKVAAALLEDLRAAADESGWF
jgi:hypothetical protein